MDLDGLVMILGWSWIGLDGLGVGLCMNLGWVWMDFGMDLGWIFRRCGMDFDRCLTDV